MVSGPRSRTFTGWIRVGGGVADADTMGGVVGARMYPRHSSKHQHKPTTAASTAAVSNRHIETHLPLLLLHLPPPSPSFDISSVGLMYSFTPVFLSATVDGSHTRIRIGKSAGVVIATHSVTRHHSWWRLLGCCSSGWLDITPPQSIRPSGAEGNGGL